MSVTWDPPPIYDQNGVITSYTLTYKGVERDTLLFTKVIDVVGGISYIEPELIGLEEHTTYILTLRANTVIGDGPTTSLEVLTQQNGKYSNSLFTIRVQS